MCKEALSFPNALDCTVGLGMYEIERLDFVGAEVLNERQIEIRHRSTGFALGDDVDVFLRNFIPDGVCVRSVVTAEPGAIEIVASLEGETESSMRRLRAMPVPEDEAILNLSDQLFCWRSKTGRLS